MAMIKNCNKMYGFTFKWNEQLKSCTFIVLFLLLIKNSDSRTIDKSSFKDIMIPDAVLQCRAACLEKFALQMDNAVTPPNCHDINNCAMCWDFCGLLFVEERHIFKSMCTNHTCVSFTKFLLSFIQCME